MDEPVTPPSLVSMRWPPLAPKNESGCRRLSRKEESTCAVFLRCCTRQNAKPAAAAASRPARARTIGLSSRSSTRLVSGGGAGALAAGLATGFGAAVDAAGAVPDAAAAAAGAVAEAAATAVLAAGVVAEAAPAIAGAVDGA